MKQIENIKTRNTEPSTRLKIILQPETENLLTSDIIHSPKTAELMEQMESYQRIQGESLRKSVLDQLQANEQKLNNTINNMKQRHLRRNRLRSMILSDK